MASAHLTTWPRACFTAGDKSQQQEEETGSGDPGPGPLPVPAQPPAGLWAAVLSQECQYQVASPGMGT